MSEMYRGLRIQQEYFGWSDSDGDADAEFVDGSWRQCGGVFIQTLGSKQDLMREVDDYFADKANLTWEFVDRGTWTAYSSVGTPDNPFLFRIDVLEDGTFDVNRSDSELIPAFDSGRRSITVLQTLHDAKQLCEEAEMNAIDHSTCNAKYGKA